MSLGGLTFSERNRRGADLREDLRERRGRVKSERRGGRGN